MKKIDFIILPFHDYKKWLNEGFRTRDAHLFQHFKSNSQINKLLVVNRPVSLAEVLIKRKSWKTAKGEVIHEEKNWQLVKVDDDTYYLDIFIKDILNVLIERKKWWYSSFNNNVTINIINKASEILDLNNKCIFLQNPMAIGVVGKLNEKVFAFDAIDNWIHHPQNKRYYKLLEKNYRFITNRADIIFTVSENLKNMFENRNDVYWISNGVDKDYFAKSINNIKKTNTPLIGYVGKIQDRIDFKLIEECLIRYSNHKFLFLGPVLSCKKQVKYLERKYKNIIFLGDIHYEKLPEKMKMFDIAIIPHLVNDFTNSMNPLKLYEYLSAGKQVVSTPVAGSEKLSEYVYISHNNKEFLDNIQKAIDKYNTDDQLINKVTETINYEYTWENKVNIIVEKLCQKI